MCRDFARIIFSVLNPDLVCTCVDFSLAGGGNQTTFCVMVVHGLTVQIFFRYQQKALPHLFVLVNCATSEVEKSSVTVVHLIMLETFSFSSEVY